MTAGHMQRIARLINNFIYIPSNIETASTFWFSASDMTRNIIQKLLMMKQKNYLKAIGIEFIIETSQTIKKWH